MWECRKAGGVHTDAQGTWRACDRGRGGLWSLSGGQELALFGCGGLLADLHEAADTLRSTRPTAVNLSWALDEVLRVAEQEAALSGEYDDVRAAVRAAAERIDRDNQEANRRMGLLGSELLRDGMNVLTHCNAGPLAAGGIGSALGLFTRHITKGSAFTCGWTKRGPFYRERA